MCIRLKVVADAPLPRYLCPQIRLNMAVQKRKDSVKQLFDRASEVTKEVIQQWSEKAEVMQHEFLGMFSKDGALRTKLRETRKSMSKRMSTLAETALM